MISVTQFYATLSHCVGVLDGGVHHKGARWLERAGVDRVTSTRATKFVLPVIDDEVSGPMAVIRAVGESVLHHGPVVMLKCKFSSFTLTYFFRGFSLFIYIGSLSLRFLPFIFHQDN